MALVDYFYNSTNMPSIRIPITKGTIRGQYQGDYYGDIRRTFNIDLDRNPGKFELSERHNMVFNSDSTAPGDSSFRRVEAFVRTNLGVDSAVRYYGAIFNGFDTARDRFAIYRTADSNFDTGWTQDTTAIVGVKYNFQDIVNFPNPNASPTDRLFGTSDDTSVAFKASSAWADYSSTPALGNLDQGFFHPLDVFEGTLLVASKNKVNTLDNADSVVIQSRVVIPAQYYIHHIFHTSSRVFLLGANNNFEGVVSEWDGFSTLPINNHPIDGVPLTGVDYYGTPIIVTSKGKFLTQSGSGFIPLKDPFGTDLILPVGNEDGNSLIGSLAYPLDPSRFAIARRGIVVDGENIKFNLARSKTATFGDFKQNSGLWILNPVQRTLYNSNSMANDDNLGHGFVRRSGAILRGLEGGISLISGNYYRDINDSTFDTSNTSAISVFRGYDDTSIQRGFVETQWINIPEEDGTWERLWIKHKKLGDSNSKILAKARIDEGPFFQDTNVELYNLAPADFDDDTAFITQIFSGDSFINGDEVEVLAGPNAGKLAHITEITGTHGDTQIITLDESFDSSSQKSLITVQRWKKLKLPDGDSSIIAGDSLVVHSFIIPQNIKNSPKIAIKLEARGMIRDVKIEEMALQYEVNQRTKK